MPDSFYSFSKKAALSCGLFFLAVSLCTTAQARLTINITKGNDQAVAVAIVPFAWSGKSVLPENVAGIVSNDLRLSGEFSPLPSTQLLSFPSKAAEVFLSDWSRLGISYLVIGRITQSDDGKYKVAYRLFDVVGQHSVMAAEVTGGPDQLRSIAHSISDAVYEKITGIKGIFSTRLIYVVAKRLSPAHTNYKLVYADMDGMRAVTILQSREPILAPDWSPDGKKVSYVSFESGRPAIYIQTLATGERERVSHFPGINSVPKWSPDGNKLALVLSKSGSPDIYVMDLKRKELTRLTRHFSIDNEPAWLPNGKGLLFTSNRGGSAQIYKLDLATGQAQRLTFQGRFNARATVFPDGKKAALIHKGQGKGQYHVALLDLQSGRLRSLTSSPFEDAPSIAPNGRMLIYSSQGGDEGTLGIISVDGRVSFRIPASDGGVREPAWSPFLK